MFLVTHWITYSRFSQTHKIGNNANVDIRFLPTGKQKIPAAKLLTPPPPPVRIGPSTSDSESNRERRVLDLESELQGFIVTRDNMLLLDFFVFTL